MPSLADRLESARRQQFVGRVPEKSLFREALLAAELPFALLHIYGPGGVGKTSLVREFDQIARQLACRVLSLDGRLLEASPDFLLGAVQSQLGLERPEAIAAALADAAKRTVLLIDTAELLAPLNSWLRDVFLPSLPGQVLVVMAGRKAPSSRWRADPGWQSLMRVVPLGNLSPEESRAFLMRRQVPAAEHEAIMAFAHGHPLALALVAELFEQRPDAHFEPEQAPDIIKTLLEQFLQETPTGQHRVALEATSQVRVLTEPLLAAMLQVQEAQPLFDWLRGLSFIESERLGLFPHDLAREALAADLRWRNPDRRAELHDRARAYYMERIRLGDEREQRRVLNDYVFLHQENPVIRAYFEWQTTGTVFTDHYRPEDRPGILAMVRTHEGEPAARLAGHWLERQPEGAVVFRQVGPEVHGWLHLLSLERTTAQDRQRDPAVAAAWRFLQEGAPLRAGERATLFRFWMARDSYQAVSPVQSRIFLNMVQHYLTTPGLAHTLIPCADAGFWETIFAFADLQRQPAADFTLDGRRYGVFGHDWRAVPPLAWLALLAQRELGSEVVAEPPAAGARLDEAAFREAVRDALRGYADPGALADNPLLVSRLVIQRAAGEAGSNPRRAALRRLLEETTQALQAHPRQAKWYRALYHTYFQPAPTQERAAELLDLPYSTFRRHLRAGIDKVSALLWALESRL